MVSKATLRSSRIRMAIKTDSAAMRSWFFGVFFVNVVSVLWRGQKGDWNCYIVIEVVEC